LLKKTNSVACSRHAHFETVVHSQAQRYSMITWTAIFSNVRYCHCAYLTDGGVHLL